MELTVIRQKKYPEDTQGALLINGEHECFTLEPFDRGLTCDMSLDEIKAIKVPKLTAIPINTDKLPKYPVVMMYWGAPHNRWVPNVLNVPGFQGIGIHSVGTHKDTEGCLGVGAKEAGEDLMANGFGARDALYKKLGVLPVGSAGYPGQVEPWPNDEKYFITYRNAESETV